MGSQPILCCIAAIMLLMASLVSGRVMNKGDPRAQGLDRAPLKIDKMTFEVPATAAGRQMLERLPASSKASTLLVKPGAVRYLASAEQQPAAAADATPAQPAITPAQLPASMPLDAPSSSAAAPAVAPVSAAPPGVTADPNNPNAIPTKPLSQPKAAKPKRARTTRVTARQLVAGVSQAPPLKALQALSQSPNKAVGTPSLEPTVTMRDMRPVGLYKEDVPPSNCRWAPMAAGIKWAADCAGKPLGSSCIGKVLEGSGFCSGKGGSLVTVNCLSTGHWGDVDAVC